MVWRARITRGALALSIAVFGGIGASGCGGGAKDLTIPVVYVVGGRVVDATTSPISGLAGATVGVDGEPRIRGVTSDADGYFVLQGLPAGLHRLRADLPGRRTTVTYDFRVTRNLVNAVVPLFTDVEIDSVLAARGAPAWDRGQGLFGLFALKSTGVPLGDALVTFAPSPGGTLVQTGEGKDPIVLVNASIGNFALSLARGGYVWDGPYNVALRPGVVLFAAPRARPNFNGFVFAGRASGPPVAGAEVSVLEGPTPGVTSTTNFLSQFSLVGLSVGRYVARVTAAGFLPTVSWPQVLDQDTTLSQVIVPPDTLLAWSLAAGGPAPDPARGHVLVDARAAETGEVLDGATVEFDPLWGAAAGGGGAASAALAQTLGSPALRLNLAPGLYRIFTRSGGRNDSPATDSVVVRAGEVTSTRIDF
ncbi:MAG: carboxypeptidase-like regulatory domain-containing protein [Candidatus Eisenbacteria bacterium]